MPGNVDAHSVITRLVAQELQAAGASGIWYSVSFCAGDDEHPGHSVIIILERDGRAVSQRSPWPGTPGHVALNTRRAIAKLLA